MLSSFPFKLTEEKSFTMTGSSIPRCLRWSSTGNTVRRCRCSRVGFETNSSSIAVRWWSGRWRNGDDTFPVRFPENRKIHMHKKPHSLLLLTFILSYLKIWYLAHYSWSFINMYIINVKIWVVRPPYVILIF